MNEFFKNRCFVILSISSIPLCMFEVYTYLPFSSLHLLMANESYFVINENKALEHLTV